VVVVVDEAPFEKFERRSTTDDADRQMDGAANDDFAVPHNDNARRRRLITTNHVDPFHVSMSSYLSCAMGMDESDGSMVD
jgi:hypothetical protein